MYHAERPNSRRNLNVALERLVGKPNLVAKRAIMANAIIAQMLPDGSIKGGSAIKMRWSDALHNRPRRREGIGYERLLRTAYRVFGGWAGGLHGSVSRGEASAS